MAYNIRLRLYIRHYQKEKIQFNIQYHLSGDAYWAWWDTMCRFNRGLNRSSDTIPLFSFCDWASSFFKLIKKCICSDHEAKYVSSFGAGNCVSNSSFRWRQIPPDNSVRPRLIIYVNYICPMSIYSVFTFLYVHNTVSKSLQAWAVDKCWFNAGPASQAMVQH